MWSGYLATVTFMDEQVGRILKALKELGLDKETAVFFTSDHGYLLGEHHFWQRKPEEEVTRVPLIIKARSKTRTNLLHRRVGRHVPHRLALTRLPIRRRSRKRSLAPFGRPHGQRQEIRPLVRGKRHFDENLGLGVHEVRRWFGGTLRHEEGSETIQQLGPKPRFQKTFGNPAEIIFGKGKMNESGSRERLAFSGCG